MRRLLRKLSFLLIGLFVGGSLGLYLGWVAWPLQITNADPSLLSDEAKQDYALMIATAYEQDNDLGMARWRLATLGAPDINSWFLATTVDAILAGSYQEQELRYLAQLATDLGLQSPILAPYLPATNPP